MPLDRPEAGWVWLHVPRREPVEVVVVGDVCTWWAHFHKPIANSKQVRAIRCVAADGAPCAWCDAEIGRRARYVFPVRVADAVRLVELGRVQYPLLAVLYDSGRWVGRRIKLRREWDAANARISLEPVGFEVITSEVQVDCADYVGTLGAAEARTIKPPEHAPPSKTVPREVVPSAGPRAPRWSESSS